MQIDGGMPKHYAFSVHFSALILRFAVVLFELDHYHINSIDSHGCVMSGSTTTQTVLCF